MKNWLGSKPTPVSQTEPVATSSKFMSLWPWSGSKAEGSAEEQKLRKPKDDSSEQKAKLARDVAKLAEQQRKFSEEVDPKGGGGAKLDRIEAS